VDITIKETGESRKSRAKTKDSAYDVLVDGKSTLFLYVNGQTYVLAWNGTLDYERLHYHMLDDLPTHLTDMRDLHAWRLTATFQTVGLAVAAMPFPLRYTTTLPEPKTVVFARYDVMKDREFVYAATAANPRFGDNELALERPHTALFDERALTWILDHHEDTTLRDRVASTEAAAEIRQAIKNAHPRQG